MLIVTQTQNSHLTLVRYPKQHRLLSLKKQSVQEHSLPPFYLSFSSLSNLQPSKFDVILIDPPFSSSFTWAHLQDLPVPSLAADPSFVFLWVGSGAGDGLERGREVLARWGYRRCEDVVWVRTNKTSNKGPGTDPPTTSLLTRTKQHCLIGIRGTVRRSTDSWFVHCNVGLCSVSFHCRAQYLFILLDTDVIIWEGDPLDPTRKPPEMYTLIENFCLGTRRLEIFGKLNSSLRRGWVTAVGGDSVPDGPIHVDSPEGGLATVFNRERWDADIKTLANGSVKPVVPMSSDIDNLRPKSPVRGQSGNGGGGGSSGGVALSTPVGNMGARFGNAGMRNFGGMEFNPQGIVNPAMGMGMGMEGMMGGAWPGMMGMGGMDPQTMMNMGAMNGMNPQMMDPQAQMAMNNGMMMGGQAGFVPMMNGMGQMGQGMGWGDGQFPNNMMPGMGGQGGMGMGQWTGY